jgi:hypothetical protein
MLAAARWKEMVKSNNQKGSSHWLKMSADGVLNQAQAQRVASCADKLKRYFKYLDKKAVSKYDLVDIMLDAIGDGFAFYSPAKFASRDVTAKEQAINMEDKNLSVFNRRQRLVPRLTRYIIHAIRAERDRILRVVKAQIEGEIDCLLQNLKPMLHAHRHQHFYFILAYMKANEKVTADPAMKLLADPKTFHSALDEMLKGSHAAATEEAKVLWSFVWTELIPKVVPAPSKATENLFHSSYRADVDAAALMKHVNVSDESLVLTILCVKGKHWGPSSDAGNSHTGDDISAMTNDSTQQSSHSASASSASKRKRYSHDGERASCLQSVFLLPASCSNASTFFFSFSCVHHSTKRQEEKEDWDGCWKGQALKKNSQHG